MIDFYNYKINDYIIYNKKVYKITNKIFQRPDISYDLLRNNKSINVYDYEIEKKLTKEEYPEYFL